MIPAIVVTGATKGIGRAIVEHFAARGYDVAFCSRNTDRVKSFEQELKLRFPGQAFRGYACDMSVKEEVLRLGQKLLSDFDHINILVNNAGLFFPGNIGDEKDGVFETIIQTNVAGTYHLTRCLLPHLTSQEFAQVFNICSTASITAYINGGSYCISKFALLGFSKVLRAELKNSNVRVTSVLPGATLTDSWTGTDLPPERFMPPEEIASVIYNISQLSPRTVVEEILLRPQLGDIGN